MDTDSYNDSHRAFVQAFLSRSTLTLETARPILSAIFSVHEDREVLANDITVEDLNSYVTAANTALSPLDLEIRSGFHQVTRERYYCLVNTSSDALTQLATTYTADEINYVKRLLDAMFDTNNKGRKEAMCVSGIEAVQLAKSGRRETQAGTQAQGMGMRDAESVLARLVEEGWLEKSKKAFYSLSARGLMELKGWLVETYNDEEEDEDGRTRIRFCTACKEIVMVGQRCARRDCPCRLHDICTQNFFRMQRSQTCPVCKTAWDGKSFVGEKAITTSESYLVGKRRSGKQTQPDPEPEPESGEGEGEEDGIDGEEDGDEA